MDLKQRAMNAHQAYEEKEAAREAKSKAESRNEVVNGLHEEMTKFFGDDLDFIISAQGDVLATVAQLDGIVFSVHWHYGYELDADYNGRKVRLWDWHSLGALLLTPEPEEPKNEAPEPVPSLHIEKRFDVVSVDDANVKHREGRQFLVHNAASDEYGDTLVIEYTDLFKRNYTPTDEDGNELPF